MKTTRIFHTPDDASLRECAKIILSGGLVVFPTETVYGLGANALDGPACKKIYEAKGRPSDNPLIIHLPAVSDVSSYCDPPAVYYELARRFLPGPLTVVLPKREMIPDAVTAGLPTVAVRVPSNPIAHRFLELCGVPVAAPSANLSGRPSATTLEHVVHDMSGRADAIIDGGESEIGLESTIVALGRDGEPSTLLRPGGVTLEMLRTVLPDITLSDAVSGRFNGRPIAPGMKYRHYAPEAPVILLDGPVDAVTAYIGKKELEAGKTGQSIGILCYDEDKELLARKNSESLGPRGDPEVQAHRLFDCLRRFSGVDVIYGPLPDRAGVGLAVYNRLVKAAGLKIVGIGENGEELNH